jgi:hypothetical protein
MLFGSKHHSIWTGHYRGLVCVEVTTPSLFLGKQAQRDIVDFRIETLTVL